MSELDPEEPDHIGSPKWAVGEPGFSERKNLPDALRDHFKLSDPSPLSDYVRLASYKSFGWRGKIHFPQSTIAKDGELVAWTSVSPSQIENYIKCKRLWYFKSIQRLPELQKGNQALGEGVHLILENAEKLAHGEIPREGYEYTHSEVPNLDAEGWERAKTLGALMIPMLPKPRPGIPIMREQKISLPTYDGGPTMIGYMDLGVPPGVGWEALLLPPSMAIVGDYKTLSDFRYMKTPAELADSVQMMTYARWAIEDGPGTMIPHGIDGSELIPYHVEFDNRQVALVHLYGRTKPPFGKGSIRNSVAHVTGSQIHAKWEKILDIVRDMDQSAKCTDAQEIPATGVQNDHCGAYGGCAYRDKCGLNLPNPIKNLFSSKSASSPQETPNMAEQSGSNLLARIQAMRNQAAGNAAGNPPGVPQTVATPQPTATPAPPAPVQAPSTVPASSSKGPVSALIEKIAAVHGGARPVLTGLVALLYAKEQNIQIAPGAALSGIGSLMSANAKSVADLVKLSEQAPTTPVAPVASGIVPADAPARTQPVITKPGDGQDPIAVNAGTPGDSDEGEDAGEAGTEAIPENTSPASGASVPAKRGRPSKAEVEAREAEAKAKLEAEIERRVQERLASGSLDLDAQKVIEKLQSERNLATAQSDAKIAEQEQEISKLTKMVSSVVSERDALKAAKPQTAQTPGVPGFVLYVDCFPVKGKSDGMVDYVEWYAPIAAAIAQSNSVADWRLIQYTSKGLLASGMRELIGAEPLPAAMSIQSSAPGFDVAMEVLSPLARQIIKRM